MKDENVKTSTFSDAAKGKAFAANWDRIKLIDLEEATVVSLTVDQQRKVWLNIDDKCAVRVGVAHNILVNGRTVTPASGTPVKAVD